MSRKRTRAPGPGRRSAPRMPVVLAALGMLGVLAVLLVIGRAPRRVPSPVPPGDLGLSPAAAYDSATGLAARQRFRASLPYFRHALRSRPDDWEPHFAYAAALSNITLQFTDRCGVMVPETRSSAERVRFMSEAIDEFERAARLAPDGTTRGRVLATWANALYVHGFVWDAFVAYRYAQEADPLNASYARSGDALMEVLQDPVGAESAAQRLSGEAPRESPGAR